MSKILIHIFFFIMVAGFSCISNAEERAVTVEKVVAEKKIPTVDKSETLQKVVTEKKVPTKDKSVGEENFTTENKAATEERVATSILLFGDGIVAGYKLTEYEILSVQLERVLSAQGMYAKVINGGLSGETTAGGRERIAAVLEKHKPDIVFIALGRSDMLKGFLLDAIRSNLRKIIELSKEQGSFVILSAVQADPSLSESYRKGFEGIYNGLAAEYKIPLYPFLLKSISSNKELMQEDLRHPSPLGVKAIASSLAAYFVQNMGPGTKIEKTKIEWKRAQERERERLIKIREENEAKRKKEEEDLFRKVIKNPSVN